MFSNNKKGLLSWEVILIAVSLVITGVVMLFVSFQATALGGDIKNIVPQINYQFPIALTNTFLNMQLDTKDSKAIFNDNENHSVKDLIAEGSDNSLKLVLDYRTKYLTKIDIDSLLSYYNDFSKSQITKDNLLFVNPVEDISSFIHTNEKNNFFYVIKSKENKYFVIYFDNSFYKLKTAPQHQYTNEGVVP